LLILIVYYFFLIVRLPLISTLFPYTTLFRSGFALEFGIQASDEEKAVFMENYLKLNNHLGEFVNLNSEKIHIYKQDTIHKFPKQDRKSTRLNSSHVKISYAVFCLKKKKKNMR